MEKKRVYVVQYNDYYGNGYDKSIEAVVEDEEWRKRWKEGKNSKFHFNKFIVCLIFLIFNKN